MQWSDMLSAKNDCNSGPHSSTRTLVREAFGKISDMLEQYAEAGKDCYAEECYPGTLHWIRLLDPDSFRRAELEETSDWFRCHLPKIVNDAAAPGVGQVKEEVLETAEEEFCLENMQPLENGLLRSKVARTLLKQMRERMETTKEMEPLDALESNMAKRALAIESSLPIEDMPMARVTKVLNESESEVNPETPQSELHVFILEHMEPFNAERKQFHAMYRAIKEKIREASVDDVGKRKKELQLRQGKAN